MSSPQAKDRRYFWGTASGLLSVLFWSITAPTVASVPDVDAFLYIGIAHLVGFFLFLGKWVIRRENPVPELRSIPLWFIAAGLVGISLHEITWVLALQQAPPLEATLIIYTWPLLVVIFTAVSLGQKLRWYHMVGGLLGFAGIAFMLMGHGLNLGGVTWLSGHSIAIVCALSWSLFSGLSARYNKMTNNVLSIIFLLSSILNFMIWHYVAGGPMASTQSLWIVTISSLFISSAYMFWDFGMKHGNAPFIGVMSFMTPVLAAFYIVILGKTDLTPHLLITLLLVMSGIGVAKYGKRL